MHARELIRTEIAALVASIPNVTTYASQRVKPFADDELPALNVTTTEEAVTYEEGSAMGDNTISWRTLTTIIEYQAKDADASKLDDFCESVETAVLGAAKSGTNYLDIEMSSTNFNLNADGNKQVITAELSFNVLYRLADGSPSTPLK